MELRAILKRHIIQAKNKKSQRSAVLSIIIPLYDAQEYVLPCLESVDKSIDGINAEVILIDDGSEGNGIARIAKTWADMHGKFKYYRIEHCGLSDARNAGVSKAKGRYLAFVDGDDIVREDMYTLLIAAAEKHKADIASIDAERFDSGHRWDSILHRRTFDGLEKEVTHITETPQLVYDSTIWNKIIRRDFWEKSGISFPSGKLYEDVAVTFPLHCKANKAAFVKQIGYEWRFRECAEKSISQKTCRLVNLQDRLDVLEMLFDFARREVSDKQELIDELKHKMLTIDILMFVNESERLDAEMAEIFRQKIKAFVSEHFSDDDFGRLDEKSREKYYAIISERGKNKC